MSTPSSWFARLISLLVICSLFGCASTSSEEKQDKVSTLPWNAPEKWEHSSPMGGAAY